jgi:phage tail sheath protein FI
MALYLSPLVDVNEIDLSTTIPAVATSIGVLVLRNTWKGPELKRQLVNNIDELIEIFGEPEDVSYQDIFSGIGFLKYGINLYCTRALAPSATFAGLYGNTASAGTLTQYTSGNAYQLSDFASEDSDEFNNESTVFDAGRPDFGAEGSYIAKDRGEYGNYVQIAYIGRNVYNGVRAGSTAISLGISSTLYDDIADIDKPFNTDTSGLKQFLVIVRTAQQEDLNLNPIPYQVVESHLVSTDPRAIDDGGQNTYAPIWINLVSEYIRMAASQAAGFNNKNMSAIYTANYTNMGGGVRNQGDSVTDADIIEAYELYCDPEVVDVNIFIDGAKSTTVQTEIAAICENRADAMACLDVPYSLVVFNKGNEATDCRDFRLGQHSTYNLNLNTSYAALYAQWLNVYDKWNAVYRWVPSSGYAAGIFANTDDVTDPWFAPAGLNRGILNNVRKLAWNPTLGERNILYKNGLNPIVSFAGQGKVVWGQKDMLDKNSAFNRINVRRLFMIIGKSVSTALKYFLFEPNDSFTRLQIINMTDPFLRDIKGRRGIFDYLIVCDERNNTPERIDRNELWCDIYIKPTRAAEFIVLNLIATKTGASFTELVAASSPQ